MEGDSEQGLVYLIGMVVCDGHQEHHHCFWANDKEQEFEIFEQFLAVVSRYDNPRIYCYGSYERAFIKRMRRLARRKKPVDQSLAMLVNTLSIIYVHIYFPTYSNGLKEVAGCLGFSWTDADASGIQSIAWRMRWQTTRKEEWKEKLIRYNLEDCRPPARDRVYPGDWCRRCIAVWANSHSARFARARRWTDRHAGRGTGPTGGRE